MFKSPLVLPLTLILAGALALLATLGIIPADMLRFWPVVAVVFGLIGLVSLSSDELMGETTAPAKTRSVTATSKTASRAKVTPPAKKTAKKSAKKSARKR